MNVPSPPLRKRWSWLPLVVLFPFAFTLLGWKQSAEQAEDDIRSDLRRNLITLSQAMQLQLREYQSLLEGARGLVASSQSTQPHEWRTYLEQVNTSERFPGVRGIGYSQRMSAEAARRHWDKLPKETPKAQIFLDNDRYVLVARQQYGNGGEVSSPAFPPNDTYRPDAVKKARDSGQPALSAPLATESPARYDLFLVLPWYGTGLAPPPDQRKNSMDGILHATWEADKFMAHISQRDANGVVFRVLDYDSEKLLYAHPEWRKAIDKNGQCRGFFDSIDTMAHGRTWRIEGCDLRMLSSMPSYVQIHRWLAFGTLGSFFLLGLGYWVLRQRAEALKTAQDHQSNHMALSHRLREIATRVPVLIAHMDRNGRYLFANQLYLRWFGIDPESIEGKKPEEVFGRELGERLSANVRRALDGETVHQEVVNEKRVFDAHYTPEIDEHGAVIGAFVVASDITKHKQMERHLSEEKERAEVTLTSIADAVVSFDQGGIVLYCNPAAKTLLRAPGETLSGKPGQEALKMYGENGFPMENHPLDTLLKTGEQQILSGIQVANASNQMVPVEATLSPMKDREGKIMGGVAVIRDVSQSMEMSRNLRHLAHHDALTGLANRMEVHARIDALLSSKKQNGVLIFLDLDHFKNINDTLGHEVGDMVLREVATRIKNVVGTRGLVARQGGDEFLILLPNIILPHAERLAAKILDQLTLPFQIHERHLRIAASAGLAPFPQPGMDRIELMRQADAAMYAAKRSGRNQYASFEPCMSHYAEERMVIEQALRNARSGEGLMVVYQPKIDAHSKTMAGYEALVRWQHEGGLRGPGYFIPIAEECGLVGKIDTWILMQACRQQAKWLARGLSPLPCSVNVSMAWLDAASLLACVDEALAQTKIPPALLQIEFTETQVMHDGDQAKQLIHALRERGVSVALDDFGTGYSNLGSLNSFGFDTVKIDRCFIQELEDPKRLSLVRAIISIGRAHGHTIVAEGVETEAQASVLAREGCHQMQGFLYSKPVEANLIQQWLTHPFDATLADHS